MMCSDKVFQTLGKFAVEGCLESHHSDYLDGFVALMDVNELGTEETEGPRKSTRIVKTKKVAGSTSLGSADIETEETKAQFFCVHCSRVFATQRGRTRHSNTCSLRPRNPAEPNIEFICGDCRKAFPSSQLRQQHACKRRKSAESHDTVSNSKLQKLEQQLEISQRRASPLQLDEFQRHSCKP